MRPLEGLKILDLTSVLMGPFSTQILGDLGAEIIKVEAPGGDIVRQIGSARHTGMGGLFLNVNRSKRSIVLDLKSEKGRDAFIRISRNCDAIVYNIRPQAMDRLGLSYEVMRAANPKIIYLGVYGFAQDGPYAGRPAYDDLIQGASTISDLIAKATGGQPNYMPVAIADRAVGIYAATCVLAALVQRQTTGVGAKVDVPMFETMTSIVLADHLGGLTFDPPLDDGGYARLLSRDRRPYQTKDGYICALVYNDKQWRSFFVAIDRPEALEDPRFKNHASRGANIGAIYKEVADIFLTRTTAEWTDLLNKADIPVMPFHTLDSVMSDPHLKSTDFFEEVIHPHEGPIVSMQIPSRWSDEKIKADRLAPELGEHTEDILRENGFSAEEINYYCKVV